MLIDKGSRLTDQRVTEWFLRERARKERQQQEKTGTRSAQPVITISRQYGAGGHSLAERLVQILGKEWEIWDSQIIDQIAQSASIRKEMVEALDEHTQTWMEQFVKSLFAVRTLEPIGYRRHLAQVLIALSQQGKKIVVGRGANFVLTNALNVRIIATFEYRVKSTMRRENLTHDEAAHRVQHIDHERAEFTRSVFGRSIDDPSAYDMVLMADTLGLEASAQAIVAAARTMFSL